MNFINFYFKKFEKSQLFSPPQLDNTVTLIVGTNERAIERSTHRLSIAHRIIHKGHCVIQLWWIEKFVFWDVYWMKLNEI